MRDDQRDRLKTLTESLAEVVLDEADPATWPGAGVKSAQWTQQERGDRYWSKRNAAATLGLLERVQRVLTDAAQAGAAGHPERPDLEQDINDAERKAAKLLKGIQTKAAAAGRGA